MPARILLVEDNQDHAQIALRALAPLGTTVLARRGGEGVERLADGPFDLVVTDWRLPDMSGLDVARRVREAGACPVLVVTSEGSEELAEQALAIPGVSFLAKDAQFAKRLVWEARAILERPGAPA